MAHGIEKEIREKQRRDRAFEELELPEGTGETDYLAEDMAKGVVIKNELGVFDAPTVARSFYDSALRFAKTAYGLVLIGFVFFAMGALYWGVAKTEVVLTPEYQKTHEQLQAFEEHAREFGSLGVKFEKSQELAEREARVREALRWREELNSIGKSIKGVEDIHPGLTTKRKAGIWKAKYDEWYGTPRSMEEMLFHSLPLLGAVVLLSIPFAIAQVTRGGRTFVVTNHVTGEKSTYMIDESLVGQVFDPVLRIWRLPVVNPLTLSFTGQYDIIPDDAFIAQVRKGMKAAGIYAEPNPDEVNAGKIRRIYRAVPNEHGYYGNLAFDKEVNYIRTVDDLRKENVELSRIKTQLEVQYWNLAQMTYQERRILTKEVQKELMDVMKELASIRGGAAGTAERRYRKKAASGDPGDSGEDSGREG